MLLRLMEYAFHVAPALTLIFPLHLIFMQWAKSEIKGSAERAVKLLREMTDYNVTPGMSSFASSILF